MAGDALEIDYSVKGDLLWMGNGKPCTDSAQNVTFEPVLDAFFADDGKCVGAHLFDAAHILLPHLAQESPAGKFQFKELAGAYSREADTLAIGNGDSVPKSCEIADGLTAHYDEKGRVVGFTIGTARKLLLPLLRKWRASAAV